jgi:glyoxylase-like metal-dependent hydrolase (beta-lactamase superfamily II)
MIFEQINNGGDRNFGYLVGDEETGMAAAVDPSYNPAYYIDRAAKLKLTLKYIICTHSHHDHVNGNDHIIEQLGIEVVMYQDAAYFFDIEVKDGDIFKLGTLDLRIIHTPGHCQDGMCILIENKLITGDTLFVGKVGGTDLEEGARLEYESLQQLMQLDENLEVYPGHDFGAQPSSTIGYEKRNNPFILQPTLEDFVHLKANWVAYKAEHGIE